MENNNENVGVFVGKCDIERDNSLYWRLAVSVELVDLKNASRVFEPVTSVPFQPMDVGSYYPVWNETLVCNQSFQTVCDPKNAHYLFLFELFDQTPEDSSIFKKKTPEADITKRRVAWAFLKPIATNNTLNINKRLKLQLFNIGRNCSIQHQTCVLYHLYAEHKRKKYPGFLEIELRPMAPPTVVVSPSAVPATPLKQLDDTDISEAAASPQITVSDWTRLPSQSCKPPNSNYMETNMGSRGVSCLNFSQSGIFLAIGSFNKISLIHIPTKKELVRFSGHTGLIYELSFSYDDLHLLSVSADCSAIVWDVNSLNKTPLFILPHASFVYCGKWLKMQNELITGGKNKVLQFWRHGHAGFELLDELLGHRGYVSCVEVIGNGTIVSGDSLGTIILWVFDLRWQLSRRFSLKEIDGCVVDALHCHPGQRRLVVTARCFGSIMFDIHTGAVVCVYANPVRMRSISSLSPCGTLLFAFGLNNVLNCWRFDDGLLLARYQRIVDSNWDLSGCVAYHPFEHMIACGVLAAPFPCRLFIYDLIEDDGRRLGLTLVKGADECAASCLRVDEKPVRKTSAKAAASHSGERSVQDKLAAIVRNIDRVLAVRRHHTNKFH